MLENFPVFNFEPPYKKAISILPFFMSCHCIYLVVVWMQYIKQDSVFATIMSFLFSVLFLLPLQFSYFAQWAAWDFVKKKTPKANYFPFVTSFLLQIIVFGLVYCGLFYALSSGKNKSLVVEYSFDNLVEFEIWALSPFGLYGLYCLVIIFLTFGLPKKIKIQPIKHKQQNSNTLDEHWLDGNPND